MVETPDAILLAKAGESQRVRELVDSLKRGSSKYHIEYMTVRRPWGSYTVLESNGEILRLDNSGKVPVSLIEVLLGDYLEEDDIERFEDVYGRVPA